jgi:uncharacterized protein YidB (DUF937 family)
LRPGDAQAILEDSLVFRPTSSCADLVLDRFGVPMTQIHQGRLFHIGRPTEDNAMSLIDTLKAELTKLVGDSKDEAAAASNPGFLSGIQELLQKEGLTSLVEKFKEQGFGDVINSWIGHGPNQLVSADAIHKVIGPETIEALAQKAGLAPGQATALLAKILPGLIDKLTPNGKIEDAPAAP